MRVKRNHLAHHATLATIIGIASHHTTTLIPSSAPVVWAKTRFLVS